MSLLIRDFVVFYHRWKFHTVVNNSNPGRHCVRYGVWRDSVTAVTTYVGCTLGQVDM